LSPLSGGAILGKIEVPPLTNELPPKGQNSKRRPNPSPKMWVPSHPFFLPRNRWPRTCSKSNDRIPHAPNAWPPRCTTVMWPNRGCFELQTVNPRPIMPPSAPRRNDGWKISSPFKCIEDIWDPCQSRGRHSRQRRGAELFPNIAIFVLRAPRRPKRLVKSAGEILGHDY